MTVETARLRLQPYTPAQLLALIDGVAPFEALTGLRAADGLRDLFVSGDVAPAFLALLRALQAADPWVLGFAVVHREEGAVIGNAAFKGHPDGNGMVEIAYGIVPGHQGRGYATEAAAALVGFAFRHDPVRRVWAHTLPAANASARVLAKCGFTKLGEVVDPEDGLVWRWERAR